MVENLIDKKKFIKSKKTQRVEQRWLNKYGNSDVVTWSYAKRYWQVSFNKNLFA